VPASLLTALIARFFRRFIQKRGWRVAPSVATPMAVTLQLPSAAREFEPLANSESTESHRDESHRCWLVQQLKLFSSSRPVRGRLSK